MNRCWLTAHAAVTKQSRDPRVPLAASRVGDRKLDRVAKAVKGRKKETEKDHFIEGTFTEAGSARCQPALTAGLWRRERSFSTNARAARKCALTGAERQSATTALTTAS